MKIAITGAAGFLGRNLVRRLAERGEVDLLRIDSRPAPGPGRYLDHDIRNRAAGLARELAEAEVLYHFAAISNLALCQARPGYALEVNVTGTANVLEAAAEAGVKRVLYASSSAILENGAQQDPDLVYSLSKQMGEDLCRAYAQNYGLDVRLAFFFNVYGPQQRAAQITPPLVPYLIACLLAHRPPAIYGTGAQRRDWVYVEDALDACEAILARPRDEARLRRYQIGTQESVSVLEIYALLQQVMGVTGPAPDFRPAESMWDAYPELFRGPCHLDRRRVAAEALKETRAANMRTQQRLGWHPRVSLEEGLRRTVEATLKEVE